MKAMRIVMKNEDSKIKCAFKKLVPGDVFMSRKRFYVKVEGFKGPNSSRYNCMGEDFLLYWIAGSRVVERRPEMICMLK